jgi:hypothetical protein
VPGQPGGTRSARARVIGPTCAQPKVASVKLRKFSGSLMVGSYRELVVRVSIGFDEQLST